LNKKKSFLRRFFDSKKDKITFAIFREVLNIPNNYIFYNFKHELLYRAGDKSIGKRKNLFEFD
jgi:hypothetical protein